MNSTYQGKPALLVPVLTPFGPDGSPDKDKFVAHCTWLLEQGAHGLAVFGTNSEANSLSTAERKELLKVLICSGVSPSALMPGTGSCSLTESIDLSRHASGIGCPSVLVMPPFFYPCVEDGIFAFFCELLEAITGEDLTVHLYHFPKMSRAPITATLVRRLLERYPGKIAGIKDSAGDWDETARMIDEFPELEIYSSSEKLLTRNIEANGGGCISATANVNSKGIRELIDSNDSNTSELQAKADKVRSAFEKWPWIPALKAYIAHIRNDPDWAKPRPPLLPLPEAEVAKLLGEIDTLDLLPNSIR